MMMRRIVLWGIFLSMLVGCRAHSQPKQAAVPPATTQDACRQLYDFFAKHDVPLSAPQDMSSGCRFQIPMTSRLTHALDRQLGDAGWKRNPASNKEASSKFVWETPVTRCTFEETEAHAGGSPVHGSIGVSGGTHLGTGFGIGIGIGSFGGESPALDYKMDCLPKDKR